MYQGLRQEVEKVNNEVIHFTQDLVRTPSPSLHEEAVAGKVESMMRDLDYDLVFTDDVGNVIGVIAGGDPEFTLVMNSHMDTVRPGPLVSWSRYPLSGDIVDGRITGVGASDCKGGIASQVFAGHVLARSQLPLRGNIVVAATVAEENGCSVGVRHLLDRTIPQIGMEPKFVILGEPTGLKICHGHDGWVDVDIDVSGTNADSARSAAEHLRGVLKLHCDDEGYPEKRSLMVASGPWMLPINGRATSRVRVSRRLFPGESAAGVLEWLENGVLSQVPETYRVSVDARVHAEEQMLYTGHSRRVQMMTAPWSTNLMDPLVDRARETLLTAGCPWKPETWQLDRLGMGTAGSVVTGEFGLPVIGFGPGEEGFAHSSDESVGVSNLIQSVFVSAVLMHGLSGAPVYGWN